MALIDNPSAITFTASPDQATISRYDVRFLPVTGATIILNVGKPTPDGSNVCTAPLVLSNLTAMVEYAVAVRAARKGKTSAWVSCADTARRTL